MTRERPAGVQSPDTDAETGTDTGPGAGAAAPEPAADPAFAALGTALAVPAVTLVTALFLLVGGMVIRVPESSGFLGPQFFPLTVGALLGVTACVAGVRAVLAVRRSPSAETTGTAAAPTTAAEAAPDAVAAASDAKSEHGDWRTLGVMAATLTAHVLLLQPLGWLLSGTLLFWGVSFALDRRSPLLDLCVAVALAAIVQICFSGLLDVSLPSGLLGKVL
ncbi:tripartite tricarboxylate transporter TctB family protein [Nocardiopsis dassonvillei]|uniref:DUF1468 domain-containing protein n=1 Tax=Nocardiopsis dassonvillei (strain ATCC 23218 / DSM 43111 / CIP 107115 / JCM 7437 / KCTC 9190 / NBRC 14626 / NCTC 10488 / NRRL B-5397 / IMRU 509) TaxID=446468 RepID=D7B0N4_NOCDD|nr:tripartite tricarboxylate transporter TctB family protein [Nocardiopsis dassonvillei]ADH66441.1 conserved hypothetical protein [Nocardiopsis dassonvillei subsp. dassonvillei DSM 43111]NKY77820.1 tripartite tricarboxylate transporter TctB family protein [Nocardiopsis dassonvillei]VEI92462.1 Tripartite tricarboxylate transporter TctB family [Nocardiopsis dassonvillei]